MPALQNQNQYLVDYGYEIALAGVVVILIGGFILSRVIRRDLAFALVFIKVSIVIVYFTFFADGTWFYGGDDYGYLEKGAVLVDTGSSPLTILFHPQTQYYLRAMGGVSLMYLHNYLSIYAMGYYYYAPIMTNILLSCLTAVFLVMIVRSINPSEKYSELFCCFYSLHWSTLIWTSFMNLKEPLVICILVGALMCFSRFRAHWFQSIVGLCLAMYLFLRLRFYIPAIVFVSVILSHYQRIISSRYLLWLAICVVLIAIYVGSSELRLFFRIANITEAPYGVIHFILQPVPWRITEPASYLVLPSILHWIFIIPSLLGGLMLWRTGFTGRLLISVIVVFIIFYGLIPLIGSTRHRAPLEALLTIAQFHFLWVLATKNRKGDVIKQ